MNNNQQHRKIWYYPRTSDTVGWSLLQVLFFMLSVIAAGYSLLSWLWRYPAITRPMLYTAILLFVCGLVTRYWYPTYEIEIDRNERD
jgi:hypothetical protein